MDGDSNLRRRINDLEESIVRIDEKTSYQTEILEEVSNSLDEKANKSDIDDLRERVSELEDTQRDLQDDNIQFTTKKNIVTWLIGSGFLGAVLVVIVDLILSMYI